MDLSVIIVNWNVCDLLRRCLSSIEANCGALSLEVIVVDNASGDSSVHMVESEFPQVQLIASRENLGYTGGNNLGAKEARGRYLLILNPDTEIVGDALERMVAYLDEHPAVGALGPQLLYPDGSVQPSRYRFPRPVTAFWMNTVLSRRVPNNRFGQAYRMADHPDDEIQSVDWVTGAAIVIRRKVWQEVGPLDDEFFMYFEEVDWCRRCRDAGWEIHYLPTVRIVHHHGKSSEQAATAPAIREQRSKILYFRKHFGEGWANAIHLFLLMNYAWQLAEEAAKWVIGYHRDARRQLMSVYWQILKSGLR